MQQAEISFNENYVLPSAELVPTSVGTLQHWVTWYNYRSFIAPLSVTSKIQIYILINGGDTLPCKVKLKVAIRHVFNRVTIVWCVLFFFLIWQQSVSVYQHFKSYSVYGHYLDMQSYKINVTIVSSKQQPYNVSINMFLIYNVCAMSFSIGWWLQTVRA